MRRCQKVVERLVESPKVKRGGVKSGYRIKGLIYIGSLCRDRPGTLVKRKQPANELSEKQDSG